MQIPSLNIDTGTIPTVTETLGIRTEEADLTCTMDGMEVTEDMAWGMEATAGTGTCFKCSTFHPFCA